MIVWTMSADPGEGDGDDDDDEDQWQTTSTWSSRLRTGARVTV